jgi:hypothetical protein
VNLNMVFIIFPGSGVYTTLWHPITDTKTLARMPLPRLLSQTQAKIQQASAKYEYQIQYAMLIYEIGRQHQWGKRFSGLVEAENSSADEAIANAANCEQVNGLGRIFLDIAAQAHDEVVDGTRVGILG